MEYKTADSLRRYSISSIVLFIIINLYPLLLLIKGINISSSIYVYSLLSIGFLVFGIIFFKTYYYQIQLIKKLQENTVKTNSIAAKRLNSLMQDEK